jgi:hypothetical protein
MFYMPPGQESEPTMTGLLQGVSHCSKGDKISFGDIVASFESRGFGPLLLLPALLVMMPTGALPGMTTICAIYTVFIVSQLVIGRKHPWLPHFIRKFSINRKKFENAIASAKPVTRKIDRISHPRLQVLTTDTAERIIAIGCMILSVTMVPLEMFPFASAIPAFAIFCFALGLTLRDGLFTLLGILVVSGLVTTASLIAIAAAA